MAVALGRFEEWMRARNYSPHTIVDRGQQLDGFIAWASERGVTRPAEVTRSLLERYQRHLHHYRKKDGEPLAIVTQTMRIVAVRVFFRWLARQNLLLHNPASELELPRLGKALPRGVLTAAEAEAVINQTDPESPFGLRDRAILETLYSTGIRRQELIDLCLDDIDFERGTVMIRMGKGKKDRVVPIGERAIAWLEKYLSDVRPRLVWEPDPGALFLMNRGTALSPHWLSHRVRRYVKAVGKQGSCHLFRHTAATLMLEGGADIRFIQAMLGHEELSSTEIYTKVSIRKLKEIHTATHPAATLERKTPAASGCAAGAAASDVDREALAAALAAESADDEDGESDGDSSGDERSAR